MSAIFGQLITHTLPSPDGVLDGTPGYMYRNAFVGWTLDAVDTLTSTTIQVRFNEAHTDLPPWTRVYAGVVVRQYVDSEGRASWTHSVVLAGEVVAQYSHSSTAGVNLGYRPLTIRLDIEAPPGHPTYEFPSDIEWIVGKSHQVKARVQIFADESPAPIVDNPDPLALAESMEDYVIVDATFTSNESITVPPPAGDDPVRDANMYLVTHMDSGPGWSPMGTPFEGSILKDYLRVCTPFFFREAVWTALNDTAQRSTSLDAVFVKGDVSPEASAVYAVLSGGDTGSWSAKNPPSQAALYKRISRLIRALKKNGTWKLLDRFFVFRAGTQAHALIDWKAPSDVARAASNESAVFDANNGFRRTASGGYVDTRFTPEIHGAKFTQNSASAGVLLLSDTVTSTTGYLFGCKSGADAFFAKQNSVSRDISYAANEAATAVSSAGAMGIGVTAVSRVSGTKAFVYNNGASFGVRTAAASTARPSSSIFVGALNDGGADVGAESEWVTSFFCGAELTVDQLKTLQSLVTAYVSASA